MSFKYAVVAAGFCAVLGLTVGAQQPPKPDMVSAAAAWDRGDFVAALTAYKTILTSPGGDAWLEQIALQTGELFQTREITADGANPRFSADSRFVAYDTGSGVSRVTRVVEPARAMTLVAEVRGTGAVFAPDGRTLAYLKTEPAEELARAQAELAQAGQGAARFALQQTVNVLLAKHAVVVIRDLTSGAERSCPSDGLLKSAILYSPDGATLFVLGARDEEPSRSDVYAMPAACGPLSRVTGEPGYKANPRVDARGRFLVYYPTTSNPFPRPATGTAQAAATATGGRGAGGGGGGRRGGAAASFAVVDLKTGTTVTTTGTGLALSADGSTCAFLVRADNETSVMVGPLGGEAASVKKTLERVSAVALSPDGARVALQVMPKDDWEIFVIDRDGGNEVRVTREIQHDVQPIFLTATRLLAATGEGRHLRSSLYDLPTLARTRLFHNNTVRTIAPEYAWVPSADGRQVLVSAERDGDTVSPERGIYLVALDSPVAKADVVARIDAALAAETRLRAQGEAMFRPIAAEVTRVLGEVSVSRIFGYEKALFDLDSKHISKPGNRLAGEYLFATYASFGYAPEFQWFEPRGALGGKSANVIATLTGTEHPELVYVVSSHYDSNAVSPGADDDSSATAALLEAARVLAKRPMPATIIFASFTGEESGLLGSREFVRRAQESGMKIVGALNNDMIGWANDHRLDNTIRYSNPGIRDVQHAASFFTRLVLFDSVYFKSTDAAAYYEAYGDIVGGLGSYPVLGNPHYHQPTDLLETVNHELVAETSKVTAASLMLLASSPSRLKDLTVERYEGKTATLRWTPSPEKGVTGYIVAYGPKSDPERARTTVTSATATIPGVEPGTVVSVKAVNAKGLQGWDWARVEVR